MAPIFSYGPKTNVTMNIKRVFGTILTLLGVFLLCYAAYLFINTGSGVRNIKMQVVYGVLGVVFFISGIGLVKTVRDEPQGPAA
jgi:uncharacterized membrane protein